MMVLLYLNKMKDNKVKPNPYRYRIKYDSSRGDCYPYAVEYYGGWRTLWCWSYLNGSVSETFKLAMCEIGRHKERMAKANEGVRIVYSE